MATLSFGTCLYTKYNSNSQNRSATSSSRTSQLGSFTCQSRESISFSDPKEKKEKEKEGRQLLIISKLVADAAKLGKELKSNLSPRQKGDWRDLMLMSLSFAVYVYISQKIVCAYCVWMSMLKQPYW